MPRLLTYSHVDYATFLVFEGVCRNPKNLSQCVKASAAGPYSSEQLPVMQMLKVVLEAGRGAGDLHRLGFVHNVIKDDNIVVGEDGSYLVDLGLALKKGTTVCWDPRETGDYVYGVDVYMEPHIVECQRQSGVAVAEPSGDWYALGITLVSMLAKGNVSTLLETRPITAKVQCGTVGAVEGLGQLLELLRPQITAVMVKYQQQLRWQGVVRHAEAAAVVGGTLVRVLEGLLLKTGQERWSDVELEREWASMKGQVEALLAAQQ
jgi:serine/threonine protein kinase